MSLTSPPPAAEVAAAWAARPCFASFISRHDSYPRAQLFDALAALGRGPVEAPSTSHHNSRWAQKADGTEAVGDKTAFNERCRFTIAPENSFGDGYTTEKLFDAVHAGVVPLYWGGDTKGLPEPRILNSGRILILADAEHPRKGAMSLAALMDFVRLLDTDQATQIAFFSQPVLDANASEAVMDTCIAGTLAVEAALIAGACRQKAAVGEAVLSSACSRPPLPMGTVPV